MSSDGRTRSALNRCAWLKGTVVLACLLLSAVNPALGQWEETAKLLPSDGAAHDEFGYSVSLSNETALIGAWQDDVNGEDSGSAYVFHYDGTGWVEEAKLVPSDGAASDYFGISVSISDDTAVIGAYWDDDNGSKSGSAYVFRYNGTAWVEEAKLLPSDGAMLDYFGFCVSVSGDAAVIGAHNDKVNGTWSGSAYVFRCNGTNWVEEAKLVPSDGGSGDQFGFTVSISANTAIVGANHDDAPAFDSGSAYIFQRDHGGPGHWGEVTKLTAPDGMASHVFGYAVAIDGDVALVSAVYDDDGATNGGSVYVFNRNEGGADHWGLLTELHPSDPGEGDLFGYSVATRDNVALIGAPFDEDVGSDGGSAYAFRYDGTNWVQEAKLLACDGMANDYFGYSVSIFDDTAVIGACRDDDNGNSSGSAYVFEPSVIFDVDARDDLNEPAHKTDVYRLSDSEERTVLRRSSTAQIDVIVRDWFDEPNWTLQFAAAHMFNGDETTIEIPFYEGSMPPDEWACEMIDFGPPVDGKRIAQMRLQIPPTAPIGEYTFSAIVKDENDEEVASRLFDCPVVLLFNPYSVDGFVYLADPAEQKEYLERECGLIWRGYWNDNGPMSWTFAQFDEEVFLAVLELLEGLDADDRSDPALVARWLMPRLNANDGDGGVLEGRWDENYYGGNPPNYWSSSRDIFEEYRETGPVKYGQCWVFAGLMTSAMRTLGVPGRPVTNFMSGIDLDTPPNRSIDSYYLVDPQTGQLILDVSRSKDAIWTTFHAWSESWIEREGAASEDWQAVDCTPVETEGWGTGTWGDGQVGPAPVWAVLAGDETPYDVPYVESEVDADVNRWVGDDEEPFESLSNVVGHNITTKAVGAGHGEDITASYKIPDPPPPSHPRQSDFQVTLPDLINLGESIEGSLLLENTTDTDRTIAVTIIVRAKSYNGMDLGEVWPTAFEHYIVPAMDSIEIPILVPWASVQPWAAPSTVIDFLIGGYCLEVQQLWIETRVTAVRGLPLEVILVPESGLHEGEELEATFQVSNPLDEAVTNVTLVVNGDDGLLLEGQHANETIDLGDIGANGSIPVVRQLLATTAGTKTIGSRVFADAIGQTIESSEVLVLPCCPADFDGDGDVDTADLLFLLGAWGTPNGDVDGDGDTDTADLLALLGAWGECP